jgi:hypothetical protein
MSDLDPVAPTPPRPDRPRRGNGRRSWVNVLLTVAIGVEVLLGLVYLFVGGFGGNIILFPLMAAWAVCFVMTLVVARRVGTGRWRARAAWLALAALGLMLVAFPVVLGPVVSLQACTDAREAAAFAVPPYGGADPGLSGGQYGCGYTLDLTEPVAPVVQYYRDGFEREGWNVTTGVTESQGEVEGGGSAVTGELIATRGDETVTITYEGAGDGTFATVSLTAS